MVRSESPGRARSPVKVTSPTGKSPKGKKTMKGLIDSEFDPFPQENENDEVERAPLKNGSSSEVEVDSTNDTLVKVSNSEQDEIDMEIRELAISASHSNGITTDQNQLESDISDMKLMPPPWRTTLEQRRTAIQISTTIDPPPPPMATEAIRLACANVSPGGNMDAPPLPDSAILPDESSGEMNGTGSRVQPFLPGGPPRRDRVQLTNIITNFKNEKVRNVSGPTYTQEHKSPFPDKNFPKVWTQIDEKQFKLDLTAARSGDAAAGTTEDDAKSNADIEKFIEEQQQFIQKDTHDIRKEGSSDSGTDADGDEEISPEVSPDTPDFVVDIKDVPRYLKRKVSAPALAFDLRI